MTLKIHLGCGFDIKEGWENVDLLSHPKILNHDLTKPLPFSDDSVDFIYSEHFLEHLDEVDGFFFLQDCYKKLKTGGVLRISIPSLDTVLYMYENWNKKDSFHQYVRNFDNNVQFINYIFFGESSITHTNKFLNGAVSINAGHKFLYTKENLFGKLKKIGFSQIQEKEKQQSSYPELQNLETREMICDLTFEATK